MKKTRRNSKTKLIWKLTLTFLILILTISILGISKLRTEHYRKGTIISGVDCSWLTVSKAEEKLNAKLSEECINLVFVKETDQILGKTIDYALADTIELEKILSNQNNGDETRIYELNNFYFNENKLKKALSLIDALKLENMYPATNATLSLTENNLLAIVADKNGFIIDFDEAYHLVYENLIEGNTTIDFSGLGIVEAKIRSTDSTLIAEKDRINTILRTVVNWTLTDDTIFTLDNNVMKDWLVTDKNGNFDIDINSNLPLFVTDLLNKISEVNASIEFEATDIGKVTVSVPERNRVSLSFKDELAKLRADLLTGKTINRSLIDSNNLSTEALQSYVEIDISRQTVWMYYNGELIVETPCVTGLVSDGKYDTPPGLFYLTYKTEDATLRGLNADGITRYSAFVDYWMPFNGDIGLHDLRSRKKFGGDIYKTDGSHGCINLPFDAAKTIYEYIDSSMPIIVYESENEKFS